MSSSILTLNRVLNAMLLGGVFLASGAQAATYCGKTLPPVKVTLVGDSITAMYAGSSDGGVTTYVYNGLNDTTSVGGTSYIHSAIGAYTYAAQQTVNAGQSGAAASQGHLNEYTPSVMDGNFNYATFRLNTGLGDRLGYNYNKALSQMADHYVMGFGTNDARGKTGYPVVMNTALDIKTNQSAYVRGWRTLLNGGTVSNYTNGPSVRYLNQNSYPTYQWTEQAGFFMNPVVPGETVRPVDVSGFNQLPHAPHIFINKITWAYAGGVGTDPLDAGNVSNVNNYFAAYSEQIARTAGANSIDLWSQTINMPQYYKDFVHPNNLATTPLALRGDIRLGKIIGTQVADVRLPDVTPCGKFTGTFPIGSTRNISVAVANMGKVQTGKYRLGFDVVLPKGVVPVYTGAYVNVDLNQLPLNSNLINQATSFAQLNPNRNYNRNGTNAVYTFTNNGLAYSTDATSAQYPEVSTIASTNAAVFGFANASMGEMPTYPAKFSCYVLQDAAAPAYQVTVRCDAKNNIGTHFYHQPWIWADDASSLSSMLAPTTLPATPSVVPTDPNALSLAPGNSYPNNQIFFDMPVVKSASGFVAAGNNAKIIVNYGGKEFARSNNTMTFTIP